MARRAAQTGLKRERQRRQALEQLRRQEHSATSVGRGNGVLPPATRTTLTSDDGFPSTPERTSIFGAATGRLTGQQIACGWCGASVVVKSRGPVPKWCSSACRHRAWEQARASRSGRVAEVLVDRPVAVLPHETEAWLDHLHALARQIRGRGLELERLRRAVEALLVEINDQEQRRPDVCW